MTTFETQKLSYFHIAIQSGLASVLCLGLPAGLLFWLILLQRMSPVDSLARIIKLLQDYGIVEIALYFIGVSVWGFFMARVSGFRPVWQVVFVTLLGASAGRWSPLTNLDGWAQGNMPGAPVHVVFALFLSGFIFSVTVCIGLAYGLLLRSWKAALTLAFIPSLLTVLGTVLTILLFDAWGIRVGTGNAAMPKVTSACTLVSALIGGAALGTMFRWWVEKRRTIETQDTNH